MKILANNEIIMLGQHTEHGISINDLVESIDEVTLRRLVDAGYIRLKQIVHQRWHAENSEPL